MDALYYENDASVCLFCGAKQLSVRDMVWHIIDRHSERDVSRLLFLCPCGEVLCTFHDSLKIDNAISITRSHLAGRHSPGITTPLLTFEEIRDHIWIGSQKKLLGVKP